MEPSSIHISGDPWGLGLVPSGSGFKSWDLGEPLRFTCCTWGSSEIGAGPIQIQNTIFLIIEMKGTPNFGKPHFVATVRCFSTGRASAGRRNVTGHTEGESGHVSHSLNS